MSVSSFQIHVISTIVTTFASAFLPDCFQYFETGSRFEHGEYMNWLMGVSPDGLFKCAKAMDPNHQCKCIFKLPFHQEMTVEVKSIYNAIMDKTLTPVLYAPRKYHVPQTAAQMEFWHTEASLYVTASLDTVSITFLQHDTELWTKLWNLCREYYDDVHMEPPNYTSDATEPCRNHVQEFIEENSHFFCELPLVKSHFTSDEMDILMETSDISNNFPYHQHRSEEPTATPRDWESIVEELKYILTQAREAILQAFELDRRKATQLIMFVLSNVDRLSSQSQPLGIPIAYCLRGKSMAPALMRTLISSLRRVLLRENVNILADCFDGEWAQVAFRSEQDKPLTLYELQRDVWAIFSDMSISKAIAFLTEATMVHHTDQSLLMQNGDLLQQQWSQGNLNVECKQVRGIKTLTVTCNGGPMRIPHLPIFCKLPDYRDRPDLWVAYTVRLELLKVLLDHAKAMDLQVLTSIDCDCEVGETATSTEHLLLHTDLGRLVMEGILTGLLAMKRPQKWQSTSIQQLLHQYMHNSHSIMRSFTIIELDFILDEFLRHSPVQKVLRQISSKGDKAVILSRLLRVPLCGPKKRGHLQVVWSLRHLCLKTVTDTIPVLALRVALANAYYPHRLREWQDKSTIPLSTSIPVKPYRFEYFSYPEKDNDSQSLMPRSVDPSHILTNLRLHCTQKQIFHCDPAAFERVCDAENEVLNRAIITEVLDKQNCALAKAVFSEDVERVMKDNGDLREANLVRHIRLFFDSMNERGISVHNRIQNLLNMSNYCKRFWRPDRFPAPGTHVCGLPHITFQCILQTISSRIQLYHMSEQHTYCQRGYSTLTVESIFSDATKMARQTNGVPVACELPGMIAKMMHINATKHDPHK